MLSDLFKTKIVLANHCANHGSLCNPGGGLCPFFGDRAWAAAKVAANESTCNPVAISPSGYCSGGLDPSGRCYGLFQISSVHCGSSIGGILLSSNWSACRSQLLDRDTNIKIAKGLSNNGNNFGAWASCSVCGVCNPGPNASFCPTPPPAPKPDIAPRNLGARGQVSDGVIKKGEKVNFRGTAKEISGNVGTGRSFQVRFYLSVAGNDPFRTWNIDNVGPLSPGQGRDVGTDLSFSPAQPYTFEDIGWRRIGMCVDTPVSPGSVAESNENNNCTYRDFPVRAPDLVTDNLQARGEVADNVYLLGEQIHFRGTTRNESGNFDTFAPASVTRFLLDIGNNGSWDRTWDVNIRQLSPGDHEDDGTDLSNLSAWTATSTGWHRIAMCADAPAAQNPTPERNENNNCSELTFQVKAPDLLPKNLRWRNLESHPRPAIVLEGDRLWFAGTSRNQGNLTTGVSFNTRFSLDIDSGGRFLQEDKFWVFQNLGPLAPFAEIESSTTSDPWTSKKGLHTLRVCVDSAGEIVETNEANNCLYLNFSVPDTDGDEFSDILEFSIGTDSLDNCPDDGSDNAWPPDFNNDKSVNILDIGLIVKKFGSHDKRYDLNQDGSVNIIDIGIENSLFGRTCTI